MDEFARLKRLPPYVFNHVNNIKAQARKHGEDIIDFGMGNPDQPTPQHILDKLLEAAQRPDTHRYSQSRGIPRLRKAICQWYRTRYDISLDHDKEAIVTIGSKDGLAHLALALTEAGDTVLVPDPAYPIHIYGFAIAGANILHLPVVDEAQFLSSLKTAINDAWPKPKVLVLNFPSNPTAQCVDLAFFEAIIDIAKEHNIWVIQDLAYADIVFDGYKAPSILQVKGAKDVAVETFSMSKSYNMPGWRVGFVCGNETLIQALAHLKSYMDYGMFTPIQVAAIAALEGPQDCVEDTRLMYQGRRDCLCEGLNSLGWHVTPPKATMFVWAEIPAHYHQLGSLAFSEYLLKKANVAVAPGVGFGDYGDKFVRFGLIENKNRIRQALRNIKQLFRRDGLI